MPGSVLGDAQVPQRLGHRALVADLFRQLRSHYAKDLARAGWDEALAQIGQMYFGIKVPTQANPLLDMMGSLFMGKGAGGKKQVKGDASPAPPPVD